MSVLSCSLEVDTVAWVIDIHLTWDVGGGDIVTWVRVSALARVTWVRVSALRGLLGSGHTSLG